MGRALVWLRLVTAASALGCGQVERSESSDVGVTTSPSGTTSLDPEPYRIDPDALEGCRSPDEPGCGMCRPATEGLNCTYWFWAPEVAEPNELPWYNAMSTVEDADFCPEYPPCASCTLRDEAELRAFESEPGCACRSVPASTTPCWSDTCACYCQRLEACPPAGE